MIRNAIARFMYGRYGNDQLNMFLFVVYLVAMLLHMVTGSDLLDLVMAVLAVLIIFRTLSRNLTKRREENQKFLRKAGPVIRWWRLRSTIHRDKEHRYFKCPSCGQQLRVPRGKGKITVTCRGCGASFQEKS